MDWTFAPAVRALPATTLPDLTRAEAVAGTLLAESGFADAEVSVLLTDDPGIHALNLQWRGYDKPTDVLSWPQMDLTPQPPLLGGEGEPGGGHAVHVSPLVHPLPLSSEERGLGGEVPILGDVAISLDTAKRQADQRGWALEEEIALLLVHGILHLLGHEDETETGAEGMRAVERRLLGKPLEKVGA